MFNGIIDKWNTGNGKYFVGMFRDSIFNQHKLELNLNNAISIRSMFKSSSYNHDFMVKDELKNLQDATYLFHESTNQSKIEIDLRSCKSIEFAFYNTRYTDFTQIEGVRFGRRKDDKNIKGFISRKLFKDFVKKCERNEIVRDKGVGLLKLLLTFKYKDVLEFLNFDMEKHKEQRLSDLNALLFWLRLLRLNDLKNIYVESKYLELLSEMISVYLSSSNNDKQNEKATNLQDNIKNHLQKYKKVTDEKSLLNKKKIFVEKNKEFLERNKFLDFLGLKGKALNKVKDKKASLIVV